MTKAVFLTAFYSKNVYKKESWQVRYIQVMKPFLLSNISTNDCILASTGDCDSEKLPKLIYAVLFLSSDRNL